MQGENKKSPHCGDFLLISNDQLAIVAGAALPQHFYYLDSGVLALARKPPE